LQSLTTDYKMYLIRVNVFSMLQDLCFSNLDQDLIFPSKKNNCKNKKIKVKENKSAFMTSKKNNHDSLLAQQYSEIN
jgi:hypothetical protein